MTTVIVKGEPGTAPVPPPNSKKDGEGYDTCPKDGCVETDRRFKSGGVDTRGESHLDWSMYHADPRNGGCGYTWTRTTPQGAARDRARGVNPKWGTRAEASGRYTSAPSDAFRENYDLIDWSR